MDRQILKILRNIILAQVASDGGKKIDDLVKEISLSKAENAYKSGYGVKDAYIKNAVLEICRARCKEIRFFVTEDSEHIADYLIYFDIKVDGVRRQVSFHSFNDEWDRYISGSMRSATHWDRKDSRKNCLELFNEFFRK